MTKNELLAVLKRLRAEEELAIPIYTEHLSSTFFLSGFEPEVQKKLKGMLSVLAKESEGHAKIFEDMTRKIQGSSQDVY